MKKYPVYYNENTYEVRWVETDSIWVDGEVIKVYHVTQKNFLGIKFKLLNCSNCFESTLYLT